MLPSDFKMHEQGNESIILGRSYRLRAELTIDRYIVLDFAFLYFLTFISSLTSIYLLYIVLYAV